MISAVDTNVLLDVFRPDPKFGPLSAAWLRRAYDDGAVLVCDVVYAELVPFFGDRLTLWRPQSLGSVRCSPGTDRLRWHCRASPWRNWSILRRLSRYPRAVDTCWWIRTARRN